MTSVVGVASRRGTRDHNADAAHAYRGDDGTVTATVIDGTGNSAELAELAELAEVTDAMAIVVTRVGYRRGGLAALITASDLIHEAYDAAAVTVQADPDGGVHTHWIGDCRAWWWTGAELRQLSTDHTMGQLLRVSGGESAARVAATHDHWLRLGISGATPATVAEVTGLDVNRPTLGVGQLVLLTSDGVHDQIEHDVLVELVRAHAAVPQSLADALVATARPDHQGYRDDATAVVVAMTAGVHE
ncbi:PP2C family protein-serine/threonine phosphatase [Micromonospora aurantiaca (nom. illeg.)]|uniref:PP2C family protein-serine/threonine phosphatase n=1 Tax=Micromonospora aurantiaca (nom. illeg.) TaxID=47850 RepID=UPI0033CA080A